MDIKIQEREQKILIKVCLVAFVAVILPNILSGYSLNYMYDQAKKEATLVKSVKSYEDRLSGIEGERKILRLFAEQYRNLVDRDVIGEINLVDLVKEMKTINDERKLFPVNYAFLDQQEFESKYSIYTKDSSIGVSVLPMTIEMGMLHDLDVFMFIQSLSEEIGHVSYPVECTLQRIKNDFLLEERENMKANCTVAWYWVNDPDREISVGGASDSQSAALSQ